MKKNNPIFRDLLNENETFNDIERADAIMDLELHTDILKSRVGYLFDMIDDEFNRERRDDDENIRPGCCKFFQMAYEWYKFDENYDLDSVKLGVMQQCVDLFNQRCQILFNNERYIKWVCQSVRYDHVQRICELFAEIINVIMECQNIIYKYYINEYKIEAREKVKAYLGIKK